MVTQPLLDFEAAASAKEQGIDRAAEHAGKQWVGQTAEAFADFLRRFGPSPMEGFRDWFLSTGGTEPPSHKAWGAVARTASSRGLIEWTGRYREAASVKTHRHPVRIWQVKGEKHGA